MNRSTYATVAALLVIAIGATYVCMHRVATKRPMPAAEHAVLAGAPATPAPATR